MVDTWGDGDLASDFAAVDWASTPVGAVATWSPALRWAVDLVRSTRFPASLFWGEDFVMLYNAAYAEIIEDKHPAALGRPGREIFPEAWVSLGPMFESVLAGEGATWATDSLVPLQRSGYLEETYFTFSYSPVRGDGGVVEGVVDIVLDTSLRVLSTRRLSILTRLHVRLAGLQRLRDLAAATLDVLDDAGSDVAAASLVDGDGTVLGAAADPRLPTDPGPPPVAMVLDRGEHGHVARVPVRAGEGGPELTLLVLLNPMLPVDEDHQEFLRLLGFTVSQHLERLSNREAERDLSLALQAAMLTRPRHSGAFDIAVHYEPAQAMAQVGGDWYDAFPRADGATMVSVGDVIGHDHGAAAAMAQLRNLLRGIAHLEGSSPASVVATLERAMRGLGVEALASAVVGDLREREDGRATFTWTNAGHLPPILIDPDGAVSVLERPADRLVGIADGPRTDHEVALPAGATLLLCSDGLVERRHEPLGTGIDRLVEHLHGCQGLSASAIARHALAVLSGIAHVEDDVALMVVRVRTPGTLDP